MAHPIDLTLTKRLGLQGTTVANKTKHQQEQHNWERIDAAKAPKKLLGPKRFETKLLLILLLAVATAISNLNNSGRTDVRTTREGMEDPFDGANARFPSKPNSVSTGRMNPRTKFRSKPKSTTKRKNPFDDGIDWSDSIFRREGWDNDPIVLESHKLMFFTIPKNACTTFKQLFRRMMGFDDWHKRSPHDPEKNGLRYLGSYTRTQQKEFMTSDEWTRAVFLRDPMERALSAYMDKGLKRGPKFTLNMEGGYLKYHCCSYGPKDNQACKKFPFTPRETPLTQENFPFDAFVSSFMGQCKDPHWAPQRRRMRNRNWNFINFVGSFEHNQRDARRLLERIGAYDEFGASGWGGGNDTTTPVSMFETNRALHKTGSSSRMNEYYTPQVESLVSKFVGIDYDFELFNLTKPVLFG